MTSPSLPVDTLSVTELNILRRMCSGLSNAQIAQQMALTPGTVKWYLKHIYAKLEVDGREQAVTRARELGLFDEQDLQPLPRSSPDSRLLRMINSLPLDVSGRYVGYEAQLDSLIEMIQKPTRLISLTGRPGAGKTALACKALTMLRFNLDVNPALDGIVCLSAAGLGLNLDQILGDLGRLLSRDDRGVFDAMIRSNELTWSQKIGGVLEEFAGLRIILFLDNLEALQHPDSGELQDTAVKMFIEKVIEQSSLMTIIVTAAQALPLSGGLQKWQSTLSLDNGLALPDAVDLLRRCDPANETELQTAPEAELSEIARRLACFPRAIEAFVGMLLESPVLYWQTLGGALPALDDDITEWISAHAISRLSPDALIVLQALAIYNQPSSYEALAFLLAPHLGTLNLRPLLARLARSGFMRANRESQLYSLHPLDQIYCYVSIPPAGAGTPDPTAPFTRQALHQRAADFYHKKHLARLQRRQLADLEPQFNEFHQRVLAGDFQQAAQVLLEIDRDHLWEWGHKNLLRQKYALLAGRINDPVLAHQVSRRQAWLKFYEAPREAERQFRRLLDEARRLGYAQGEADALSDLAQTSRRALGSETFELHEQALAIYRKLGDQRGAAEALGRMGAALTERMDGDQQQAAAYLEAAADIQRELGNFSQLSFLLSTLGIAYENQGLLTEAVKSQLEAVILAKEINIIEYFVRALIALARTYSLMGENERAISFSREAVDRARTITGAQMTNLLLIASATHGLLLGQCDNLLGGIGVLSQAISEAGGAPLPYMQAAYAYLGQLLFLYGDLQAARVLITPACLAPEFFSQNVWIGILLIRFGEHEAAQDYLERVLATALTASHHVPARYAAALARAGLAYLAQDRAAAQSAAILFRQARSQAEMPAWLRLSTALLSSLEAGSEGALLRPILDGLE